MGAQATPDPSYPDYGFSEHLEPEQEKVEGSATLGLKLHVLREIFVRISKSLLYAIFQRREWLVIASGT
jgi:hypothetical protein